MKKISREQSASAGHNKFNTGKPCKAGHFAERWVISGSCVTCSALHSLKSVTKKRKALRKIMKGS